MNESQIREYIRKELSNRKVINEMYGAYMSSQDFYDIFDMVKDVWEVTKIAIKDILSSTAYVYDVFVALDGKAIQAAQEAFGQRKERIVDAYNSAMSKISDRMGKDFHMIAFLAAPGPYLLTKAYVQGPGAAKEVVQFLQDAGINLSDRPLSFDTRYEPDEANRISSLMQFNSLTGNRTKLKQADFELMQSELVKALNTRFGMGPVTEGVRSIRKMLLEEKTTSDRDSAFAYAEESVKKNVEDALKDLDSSKFVKPEDIKKLIDMKKEEYQTYAGILNSPVKFIIAIGKAKTTADVRKATEFLKGTPFKIEGMGTDEEKKIAEQAKVFVADAKKNKKIKELLKAADVKTAEDKVTDEELLDAAVVVLTKNAIEELAKIFNNPADAGEKGKKLLAQMNEVKASFIKAFIGDIDDKDMELMEKSKSGKEMVDVLIKGKNEILSAGLREQK